MKYKRFYLCNNHHFSSIAFSSGKSDAAEAFSMVQKCDPYQFGVVLCPKMFVGFFHLKSISLTAYAWTRNFVRWQNYLLSYGLEEITWDMRTRDYVNILMLCISYLLVCQKEDNEEEEEEVRAENTRHTARETENKAQKINNTMYEKGNANAQATLVMIYPTNICLRRFQNVHI